MHDNNYMGKNFFWWTGVVEDRHDELAEDGLKLGRVRVRILGVHSPKHAQDDVEGEGIAPEELHWAFPMQPITSAAVDGIGQTPLGVVEGSWVFGFSRDGEFSQDLVIMGTAGGFQSEKLNPAYEGFSDPNGVYPEYIGEPATNRLARNDSPQHDIIDIKEGNRVPFTIVPIALDGIWSQPDIQYEAEYPYNHVRESESGHVEEWDDTLGKERTHRYHKSGTYEEVYPEGDRTVQVIGSDHKTVYGDEHIVALQNVTITALGNVKILGLLNVDIQALFDVNIVAGRAVNIMAPLINEVSGTHTVTTGAYSLKATVINFTAGVFNNVIPITNFYGSIFVAGNTQTTTMDTLFSQHGFIITGGCSGC